MSWIPGKLPSESETLHRLGNVKLAIIREQHRLISTQADDIAFVHCNAILNVGEASVYGPQHKPFEQVQLQSDW